MKKFLGLATIIASVALLTGCASTSPNLENERSVSNAEIAQVAIAGDQFLQYGSAAEGEGFEQYKTSIEALNEFLADSDKLTDQEFIDESKTLLTKKDVALAAYGEDISAFYQADIQDRIDRYTGSEDSKAALDGCLALADNLVETLATSTNPLADVHELSACSLFATADDVAGQVQP